MIIVIYYNLFFSEPSRSCKFSFDLENLENSKRTYWYTLE